MKKLILFFTCMVIAVSVFSNNDIRNIKSNGDDKCAYCCPKCKHCDIKEGECSKDKCALVKNGTYCCTKDMTTSEVAAKCPKCSKEMHKVECHKAGAKK